MKLDIEESDSKKEKDVAFQSVENAKVTNEPYPEDDLAMFITQFRRILKNKGRDIKKAREFSKDSSFNLNEISLLVESKEELLVVGTSLLLVNLDPVSLVVVLEIGLLNVQTKRNQVRNMTKQ